MTQAASMENLPALPRGWVWTRLGDVLGFVKGKKPKNLGTRNNLLTIPYININAFENKIFDEFTDADKCPLCQTKDVLIVWDGARCGLVGRGVAGAIGSTLAKLTCFEVNSTYIFYFLQSMYESINKRPRGVGIPHIEPSIFWNIPVLLPPLPEQHRIVAKIEELFTRIDAGVEALKKIKAQLKRYRQSILKHAFEGKLTAEWRQAHKGELEPASVLLDRIKGERRKNAKDRYKELPPLDTSNLPKLPEGWVWTRVGNTSEMVQYGTSEKANGDSSGIPVIRMGNIQDGKLVLDELKYFPEGWPQLDDFILQDGDVLFNRTNSAELVGKTAVYKSFHPRAVFASYLIRVRVNANCYSPDMLSFFINSLHGRRYIASVVSQQVGQANVNGTKLSLMPIPVPPLAEQHQLVSEIKRRFSVADEIEKTVDHSLKQAERLRQSILKRAFEGKLVPQDPNDEPAEKLLERIRQERARQQAERKPAKSSRNKSNTKQMRLV
jgi:type I restriction enzyme S subunit